MCRIKFLANFIHKSIIFTLIPSLLILPLWQGIALGQSAGSAVKPRVAVLDFTGVGISKAESGAVSDQMRNDLVNLQAFTVLDRAQTESVINELTFQQEGLTDTDQAAKIGKILNVEFIVTGRITRLGDAYQVIAQMISVETAEIVRSENILYRGDILGLLSENIATMAARLSQVDPSTKPSTSLVDQLKEEPKVEPEEEGGMPWWGWALIGVGVVGLASAGGGDDSTPASSSGGGSNCPSGGGCGEIGLSW